MSKPEIRVGTMGFSYKEWAGPFYPRGARPEEYLRSYSQVFDTVEMDTTFYGPPRAWVVRTWYESTPEGFVFTAKMPRAITHDQGLRGSEEDLRAFLASMEPLGPKLGPLLIQLPPSFGPGERPTVEAFLRSLPRGFSYAIEFRDPGWVAPETAKLLAEHGVCWAGLDLPWMPRDVIPTSGFGYIRLLGDRQKVTVRDRVVVNRDRDLEIWREVVVALVARVSRAFVLINNHYSGHSPATANRLKEMLGQPVRHTPPASQLALFE